MLQAFKEYEKTIPRKHSFNWNPKYQEEFRTTLTKPVFFHVANLVFEKLGWDFVFREENSIEAIRPNKWKNWTEEISIEFKHGKIKVKSRSLGNEMWDNGRNSKRVRLFIYAFKQTEKEFDKAAIKELEKSIEKSINWDDYEIPQKLPQPTRYASPNFWIPVLGGLLISLIMGFFLAWLADKNIYIIGLFEVGVAITLVFILKQLIKMGNYTNYEKLVYLLIGMSVLTYFFKHFLEYFFVLNGNYYESFGFYEFLKLKFSAGLVFESVNWGWIGLLVSWIIQLAVTFFIGLLRLGGSLVSYQLERVPNEVRDFAYYHFVKEKTEEEVRNELSKLGWDDKQLQTEVFESIDAYYVALELNRG